MPKGIYGNRGLDNSKKAKAKREIWNKLYAETKYIRKMRRFIKESNMTEQEHLDFNKHKAVVRSVNKAVLRAEKEKSQTIILSKSKYCLDIAAKLKEKGYIIKFKNDIFKGFTF